MLWNEIFEFFVIHIFGGRTEAGTYPAKLGATLFGGNWVRLNTTDYYINIQGMDMPIGNYYSYLATLISVSIILVLCCLFVFKIIKLIGGLIR